MQWFSTKSVEPDEDTLYAICVYNDIFKRSMPADKLAVIRNEIWYWWYDGFSDEEVDEEVTHFMQLTFPKEEK